MTGGFFAKWWPTQSPFNRVIDAYDRVPHLDAHAANATKLVFCGQFAFLAQRVE